MELSCGERLRTLRLRKRLTMAALGKLVGCTANDIYRLEWGKVQQPRLARRQALAKALGVSMAELWQGAGDTAPRNATK